MLRFVGLILIVATSGVAYWFTRDEDNAAALRSSAGFIDQDRKFGIRIGDHISTARRNLHDHGFSLYARDDLQTCLSHEYPTHQAIAVYVDDSWRRGTACVAYERASGVIRSIEWSYGPFTVEL